MKDEVSKGDLLAAVGSGLVIFAESFEEPQYNLFWQREVGSTEVDLKEEGFWRSLLWKAFHYSCSNTALSSASSTMEEQLQQSSALLFDMKSC